MSPTTRSSASTSRHNATGHDAVYDQLVINVTFSRSLTAPEGRREVAGRRFKRPAEGALTGTDWADTAALEAYERAQRAG